LVFCHSKWSGWSIRIIRWIGSEPRLKGRFEFIPKPFFIKIRQGLFPLSKSIHPTIEDDDIDRRQLSPAGGGTVVHNTFNVGGNTIMSNMDEAVFEQRVLTVVRRNLSV